MKILFKNITPELLEKVFEITGSEYIGDINNTADFIKYYSRILPNIHISIKVLDKYNSSIFIDVITDEINALHDILELYGIRFSELSDLLSSIESSNNVWYSLYFRDK